MSNWIETIREAASFIDERFEHRLIKQLHTIADSMEKCEPVGEIATEPFGDGGKDICILKWRDHYKPKLGDSLFTYPPDAQAKIAELESDNNDLQEAESFLLMRATELKALLAEYKADAERYRWLKAQPNRWMLAYMKRSRPLGESLNEAIDAAIAKVKP